MAVHHKAISWMKAYYDRLVAGLMIAILLVSLLYLAISVGNSRQLQESFDRNIETMKPVYPRAEDLNVSSYETALSSLEQPFQIPSPSNAVCVPEARFWCEACFRPVPYTATVCPHCNTAVRVDPDEDPHRDLDGDGMKDVWEIEHGLNPREAGDATRDADGDGFTNLEESRAEPPTDPRNNLSYPPVEVKLEVTAIEARPFKLRFKSTATLPDGSFRFGVNEPASGKTHFVKLGDDVQGFVVVKYEPKSELTTRGGITRNVDMSELTLQRGSQTIILIKDVDVQYNEYTAHLLFKLDMSTYTVQVNEELELKGKKYKVLKIDSSNETVVLERLNDSRQFEVRKFPAGEKSQR